MHVRRWLEADWRDAMSDGRDGSRSSGEEMARDFLTPLPGDRRIQGGERVQRGHQQRIKLSSAEQWQLLGGFPVLVGVCVALADDSGHSGTKKELETIPRAVAMGAERYPGNRIIQGAVRMRTDDQRAADAEALARSQTRGSLQTWTMRNAEEVARVLSMDATPREAEEYKHFVLDVGVAVANAAKEGHFPRIVGEAISEWERETIQRIGTALRLRTTEWGIDWGDVHDSGV
jgi:hypothetical protein